MKKIFLSFSLILFMGANLFALTPSEIEAARSVIARFTSPTIAASLKLEPLQIDSATHAYQVADNGKTIRANSAIALCKGFYANAKNKGAAISSWSGSNFDAVKAFSAQADSEVVVAPFKHYQYFNVVTFGYTMPYWDKQRWMEEIDWMALHGFDMPLALIANEAISYRVWKKLGLSDEEILGYLVGPAHFPWLRMGNLSSRPDSPLPIQWLNRSIKLQHDVLDRMRSLGMKPIVNGFAGFVPKEISRIYPEAKLLQMSWSSGAFNSYFLSPSEEAFKELGRLYVEEWEREFGKCDYYLADSFNEMRLPWKTQKEKLAGLASCGENIYGAISAASPNATWVIQGWMLGYSRDIWNTKTLGALLQKVPTDKVLILDMAVDYNFHFWKNGADWEYYKGFIDRPWIYSTIPNMGGKVSHTGVLEFYANGHLKALSARKKGNLIGYGTAPEGIENNEVIYELISDAGWSSKKICLKEWLKNYNICRYGKDLDSLNCYWEGMQKSVYGSFTDHPRHMWQFRPSSAKTSVMYNANTLAAYNAFAKGYDELKENPLYQADLKEIAAMAASIKLDSILTQLNSATVSKNVEAAKQLQNDATELFLSIDYILKGHPTLDCRRWISFARRAAGEDKFLADYYESNARRLITIWGPPIDDYAAKIWSGLVGSYYLPRHEISWKKPKESLNESYTYFEQAWVEDRISLDLDREPKIKDALELIEYCTR